MKTEEEISYQINKGINRPIEFRGLKGQYIYILAIGLAVLLVGFALMYIAGVPVYLCLPVVLITGSGLFAGGVPVQPQVWGAWPDEGPGLPAGTHRYYFALAEIIYPVR